MLWHCGNTSPTSMRVVVRLSPAYAQLSTGRCAREGTLRSYQSVNALYVLSCRHTALAYETGGKEVLQGKGSLW